MPKFPEPPPPEHLARIHASVKAVSRGALLWRVYFRRGPHPAAWGAFRHFGPTSSRFDHHEEPPRVQERGILYAASGGITCFAEVFQETRIIDTLRHEPWLVAFRLARAIRLLDLTGSWCTRAGASMAIATGPRPRARRWSRAVYAAYPGLDGLWYPSSMHANQPAIALFERAAGAIPKAPAFHRALADPTAASAVHEAAQVVGYIVL
ncbi:MAG: RES family NAD+ phosphorylase [Planctomycetes bacterium]|nr:RES family NAD+ phosphorylase [Planctomycetota bacterium]